LEGSNDGVNFSDVFEHVSGTQPDGDSEAAIYPILFPYVRANVYSVALGSATALTITVEGSQ